MPKAPYDAVKFPCGGLAPKPDRVVTLITRLDHNPPRIQPRNLFDIAVGDDNLFRGDHYKWSLQFTVINLTNKTALYNFLSTFSGTHYVTARTETIQLGFHF